MNTETLPGSVQRVSACLAAAGHTQAPRLLDDAARTAQQAADALGVQLGQIAKSIIFKRKPDEEAVLVITSGDRRVDEAKVQALVCAPGQKLGRADAEFVRAKTGFAIGGVAPIAHATQPVTLIDRELFRFNTVWAAAGHPHAVFEVTPQDLQILSDAPVADVVVCDESPIPSPCTGVCLLESSSGYCQGCLRTLDEIAAWGQADEVYKRAVVVQLG
ncbi:MAG: YbaK/EbsC family protein, partial [Burkholderiaceae bacterium]